MNTSLNNELQQLQMELRAQNFDVIRFSTYRIACKLRFIQKKLNFHLIDLSNVIESLRECLTIVSLVPISNDTNSISHFTSTTSQFALFKTNPTLSINQLTVFLTSIYTNLNKRLPLSRQIAHIDKCVQSAIAWLLFVYKNNTCSIRLISLRVVLILLCTGKLIDKMHHLFASTLSVSSSNSLTFGQIDEILHEILAVPYALQEISYSTFSKNNASLIFSCLSSSAITVDNFVDLLVFNNKAPVCLQWLAIFHRLISVENVIHRVKCSACERPSFSGFRYKCQQCHRRTYQLCQDCFWRGRTSDKHLSTHEMKEYTYFTPPKKHFRNSIRKSLQCLPKDDKPYQYLSSLTIDKEQQVPKESYILIDKTKLTKTDENKPVKIDIDEHKQIASYSKQLTLTGEKQKISSSGTQPQRQFSFNERRSRRGNSYQQSEEKKMLISKLEAENRRIVHEINTLRAKLKYRSLIQMSANDCRTLDDADVPSDIEQRYTQTLPNLHINGHREFSSKSSNHIHQMGRMDSLETVDNSPHVEHELRLLITRKHELESRIQELQKSREELAYQLDNLGQNSNYFPDFEKRSTIYSSRDRLNTSPLRVKVHPLTPKTTKSRSQSTPATPNHYRLINHLQNDLLLAADSLTSAMSSLVQQLNSENIESFQSESQTKTKYNCYPCDSDNRTDEDLFLISDDD